jgi:hypothetical protein
MKTGRRHRFSLPKVLMIILIVIAAASLLSFIVMNLWNAILPGVIHVSAITFPQALGILVLSKILFGGFRGRLGWRGEPPPFMQRKFANMTEEERERFKQEWRNKCGRWGMPPTEKQNIDQSKTS